MIFSIPDPRFPVAVATFAVSRHIGGRFRFFVFASTTETRHIHNAPWLRLEGVNAILIGNPHKALAGLLTNYSNLELQEKIGLSPTPAAKLRDYLGVAGKGRRKF